MLKMRLPRVFAVMIDQLAGHWVDGVKIQATGFAPPSVEVYHQLGLIPNISNCIRNGLWVRHPWNRGICSTIQVCRYIVYGVYSHKGGEHIVSSVKSESPGIKAAAFGNWQWDHATYYSHPNYHIGPENFDFNFSRYTVIKEELKAKLPHLSGKEFENKYPINYLNPKQLEYLEDCGLSGEDLDLERAYFVECKRRAEEKIIDPSLSDHGLLHQHIIPWIRKNRDWAIIYMHWVDHDNTICPAYVENPSTPFDDKHHHLTDYVDKNVGDLVQFLKKEGFWEETYLILFSDHGYHLNCSAPEAQKRGRDFCSNHGFPHDCFVWDYDKGKATKVRSDGCRRISMTITGGALPSNLRGEQIEEAEIIDLPATIADIYGISYSSDGMSILSK